MTLVDAPDAAISATMLTLLKAATTSPNDIVYFANDDKYPIQIDSERASAATELVRGAINDETFGGLHLGCFRGSHFTKDQCKVLRNATDPLLLVKCDGYCKCFFCHHFSRAWVFLWPRVVRTDGSARAAAVVCTVAARRTRRMHPGAIDASPGRLAVVLFWANGLQGNFLRVKSASNELCSMIHCKVGTRVASYWYRFANARPQNSRKTSMASVL